MQHGAEGCGPVKEHWGRSLVVSGRTVRNTSVWRQEVLSRGRQEEQHSLDHPEIYPLKDTGVGMNVVLCVRPTCTCSAHDFSAKI